MPPLAVVTAALALTVTAPVPPPKANDGPVRRLELDTAPPGDVSELLHIVNRSGRVTMADDAPRVTLVAEFYRDGKKADLAPGIGYDHSVRHGDHRDIRFVAQVADLDYLPLGGGRKGHSRLLLKIVGLGGGASAATDVPKELFDFSAGVSSSWFSAQVGSAEEVPLFYLVAQPKDRTYRGGSTPEEVVRLNAGAQVAIFSLRIGDSK